ncbi:MAG: BcsR/BcsP family cellulose biosynthesis protein [Nitrosomonadales bacterium]|jgi:hypothetical protein
MKKAANADIRNLFKKFGGDTSNYQEIQQEYVVDQAKKNWPIVTAIEKERISAPQLRASAENPVARAAGFSGANTGSFNAAQPGVIKRAPVIQQTQSPALFAKADVPPPARTLFSSVNTPVSATRSLFSAMSPPVQAEPGRREVERSDQDKITSVFSRLLNPQNNVAVNTQDKSLRSLFGFLKK